MAFCTACGYQNDDTARFCTACGQKIPVAANQIPSAPTAPSEQAQQPPIYRQPVQQRHAPPPPPHQQPVYQQPAYQQPFRSAKDKSLATILAWLCWPAFDFYLGNNSRGVAKLLTLGGFGIWALIDAIKMLSMSQQEFDQRYNGSGR